MATSWAKQVLDLLTSVANISASKVHFLSSFNGTYNPNTSVMNNLFMENTGVLGLSINTLSANAIVSITRNNTDSYLNDNTPLEKYCLYNFDLYVNQSDAVNFKLNITSYLDMELFFRRT